MAGSALRREDALHARLPGFRRRMDTTMATLGDQLRSLESPSVSLSGGKDSAVTLALCALIRPGIAAIWSDDELEYPEQEPYIPALCEAVGASLTIIQGDPPVPHAGWFQPWRERPYFREPLPGTLAGVGAIDDYARSAGHDASIIGLRADEAPRRRKRSAVFGDWHALPDGFVHMTPIQWWSLADVWAAIGALELPYNPVYDRLSALGVERREQRVGPLPLTAGWIVRDGWPLLHRRLIGRYGNQW